VSFAGGISSVTITGDLAGGSFVVDDVTYVTPASGVPEPGSGALLCGALLAVVAVKYLYKL
jgi:hypothetical protein